MNLYLNSVKINIRLMEDIEIFVPEFEYRERDLFWYLCIIFFAFLFILIALISDNPTFIAVIMLGGSLLILRSRAKPQLVPFAINEKGIYLKNKFWDYKDIKDFSLFKVDGGTYFIFTPKGTFQASIKIPVKDSEIIRKKLNNLLLEVEYQESFIDMLIRLTGL